MNKKEEAKRARYYDDPFALPPECDSLCLVRKCFNKYEIKGPYSQGRGYTRYYSDFRPICATRAFHGCPFIRLSPEDKISMDKVKELVSMRGIPRNVKRDLLNFISSQQKAYDPPNAPTSPGRAQDDGQAPATIVAAPVHGLVGPHAGEA